MLFRSNSLSYNYNSNGKQQIIKVPNYDTVRIDNGAIIAERRFEINEGQEVKSLYDRTFEESVQLFQENIGSILSGNYTLKDQLSLLEERGLNTYYRKDIFKLKEINLNDSADIITRKVRATAMPGFEPPFALVECKKYYIIPENQYKIN